MDYRAMFLIIPLLSSALHPAHAGLTASESNAPKKSMTAHQPLTLSSFFKPEPKGYRQTASPVQYTFMGTVADSINYIRICMATNDTCITCNTGFAFIDTGKPIAYAVSPTGTKYGIPAASVAAYLASQGAASGNYNIGMYLQSTGATCTNSSHCSTSVDTASTPYALCMQATYNATTQSVTALSQKDNKQASLTTGAPLVASLSNLALKVAPGIARTITIKNNSSSPVTGVNYTVALPAGSSINSSPNPCGTILANGTCVLSRLEINNSFP